MAYNGGMRNGLVMVGIGAIVLAGGWWFLARDTTQTVQNPRNENVIEKSSDTSEVEPRTEEQGAVIGEENLVEFKCDGGKTITAVFERDIVGLTLSDGRQVALREAQSGSGMRYLSNDQRIEFRGQGSKGTLVEEGETTYTNCITSN